MKKIILGSIVAASVLTTSAIAKDSSSMHFGYDHVSIYDTTGNGGEFGVNYVIPLKVLGNGDNSGLELGFGTDLGYGVLSSSHDIGDSTAYQNVDGQVFAGYQYSDFYVRGGIGYGFLRTGSSQYSIFKGMEYTASTGYNFTKKYGVDIFYKNSNMSPVVGPDTTVNYAGINLVIHR